MAKLPVNVFRSADESWQSYGEMPSGYGCSGQELRALQMTELGAHIEEVPPGLRSAVIHHHLVQEEQFFVLEGTLTVRELPRGEDAYREFTLRAGELVVYRAAEGLAHQFHNRSEQPARFLALSTRSSQEVAVYPDSGKVMLRGLGFVGFVGEDPASAIPAAQAAAEARPARWIEDSARPPHVVSPADHVERDLGGAFGLPMARLGGATQLFLNRDRLPPGTKTGPLHAHSAEEELLLVLAGHPTLRQVRAPSLKEFEAGEEERLALKAGDLVHWGAGDGVAHQVLNEASEDALLLVIGTERAEDVLVLPDSGEVVVRALGLRGRLQPADYWAGEAR